MHSILHILNCKNDTFFFVSCKNARFGLHLPPFFARTGVSSHFVQIFIFFLRQKYTFSPIVEKYGLYSKKQAKNAQTPCLMRFWGNRLFFSTLCRLPFCIVLRQSVFRSSSIAKRHCAIYIKRKNAKKREQTGNVLSFYDSKVFATGESEVATQ